jgi:NAD(P)-dependent dehydrogenase (short-subunit alcohol dehydrogenase family)
VIPAGSGVRREEIDAMDELITKTDLSQHEISCRLCSSSLAGVAYLVLEAFVTDFLLCEMSESDCHFLTVFVTVALSKSCSISNPILSHFFELIETDRSPMAILALTNRANRSCEVCKQVLETAKCCSARRPMGGTIVNIASSRAVQSVTKTEAYSVSKGAIVALIHAMSMSLGTKGKSIPVWIDMST